jgi:hypothetical protein
MSGQSSILGSSAVVSKPQIFRAGGEGPRGDLRQSCLARVRELAEPLTAIANYLEAATLLHGHDSRSAWVKLGEIFEKSKAQVARADEGLRKLRDLLQHEKGTPGT